MFDLDALSTADRLFTALSEQPATAPRPAPRPVVEQARGCPHLAMLRQAEASS